MNGSNLREALATTSSVDDARVVDALVPRERSLSVALARAAAVATGEDGDGDVDVEPVETAIASLAGYVRLRDGLFGSTPVDSPTERDAAVLAGDYFHARAYEAVDRLAVDDAHRLALYRILTAGSRALARRFLDPDAEPSPAATLVGVAGELGSAAAGAPHEAAAALGTYGRALATAVEQTPSREPYEAAVRTLAGDERAPEPAGEADAAGDSAERDHHLDRAHAALRTFVDVGDTDVRRTVRLERATRLPFGRE